MRKHRETKTVQTINPFEDDTELCVETYEVDENGIKYGAYECRTLRGRLLATARFREGKLHGLLEYYEADYSDGKLQGDVKYYQANYRYGVLHGDSYTFKNGLLVLQITYKRGKPHGDSFAYKNGQLSQHITYHNGLPKGMSYYYANGELIKCIIYKKGKIVSTINISDVEDKSNRNRFSKVLNVNVFKGNRQVQYIYK